MTLYMTYMAYMTLYMTLYVASYMTYVTYMTYMTYMTSVGEKSGKNAASCTGLQRTRKGMENHTVLRYTHIRNTPALTNTYTNAHTHTQAWTHMPRLDLVCFKDSTRSSRKTSSQNTAT